MSEFDERLMKRNRRKIRFVKNFEISLNTIRQLPGWGGPLISKADVGRPKVLFTDARDRAKEQKTIK